MLGQTEKNKKKNVSTFNTIVSFSVHLTHYPSTMPLCVRVCKGESQEVFVQVYVV